MEVLNIVLIGPRCVGKTNTGENLARLLDIEFIDGDNLVESKYRTTIRDIVEKNGWEYFRSLENEAIRDVISKYNSRIVFAPGAGAVAHEYSDIREENIRLLKKFGKIFLILPSNNLEENARIIYDRMNKDDKSATKRPNLTDLTLYEEICKNLNERDRFYKEAADKTICTHQMNELEVAEIIKNKISKKPLKTPS